MNNRNRLILGGFLAILVAILTFSPIQIGSQSCEEFSPENYSVNYSWVEENETGYARIQINTSVNSSSISVSGQNWSLERSIGDNKSIVVSREAHEMVNGAVVGGNSEWAILPKPTVRLSSHGNCKKFPSMRSHTIDSNNGFFAGNGLIVIGNLSYVETRNLNNQNFTVVVTGRKSYDSPENISGVWDSLEIASNVSFNPESQNRDIILYSVSDTYHTGMTIHRESGPKEFYVLSASGTDSIPNTYIHEYIHTQQNFDTAEGMDWVREGSAHYFSIMLLYENDTRISRSDVEEELDLLNYTAPLNKPNDWNGDLPYYKGGKTLAHLDRKIQNATCGEKTVLDLIQWMSTHDGQITIENTENKIRRMAGDSVARWFQQAVSSSGSVQFTESDVPNSIYGSDCSD